MNAINVSVVILLFLYIVFMSVGVYFSFNSSKWLSYENKIRHRKSRFLLAALRWLGIICLPIPALGIWFKTKHKDKFEEWERESKSGKKK